MSIQRFIPSESSRLVPATMAIAGASLLGVVFVPQATAHVHTDTTGAHAATANHAGTATCAGSQTVTYSPGLTDRPRRVTIDGRTTLNHCSSTTDPTISGGTSTFTATGTFSCTSGTYTGIRKITWNNGKTSTLSFTSTVSVKGAESIVAIKGTVTGGEFGGQKWGAVFTMFTTKPTACATPHGLATTSGPLLLSIGSLLPGLVVPHKTRPIGA